MSAENSLQGPFVELDASVNDAAKLAEAGGGNRLAGNVPADSATTEVINSQSADGSSRPVVRRTVGGPDGNTTIIDAQRTTPTGHERALITEKGDGSVTGKTVVSERDADGIAHKHRGEDPAAAIELGRVITQELEANARRRLDNAA